MMKTGILFIYLFSRSFCSYVYLSHFLSDFRDSLDRKLTFARSGGEALIGRRIVFVSIVLNLVLIRQERSQMTAGTR